MNKIYLNDNEEDFEIISDEDLQELVRQLFMKKLGKDEQFSGNAAALFISNFRRIIGYEKCNHTFGEWTLTIQRIKEDDQEIFEYDADYWGEGE